MMVQPLLSSPPKANRLIDNYFKLYKKVFIDFLLAVGFNLILVTSFVIINQWLPSTESIWVLEVILGLTAGLLIGIKRESIKNRLYNAYYLIFAFDKNVKEKYNLLSKMPKLTKYLDSYELVWLAKNTKLEKWNRGHKLFDEGDNSKELYFIVSGRVLVFMKGRFKVFAFEAGDLFGEMAAIDQGLRSASAEMMEESIVLRLNGALFEKALRFSKVKTLLLEIISLRTREFNNYAKWINSDRETLKSNANRQAMILNSDREALMLDILYSLGYLENINRSENDKITIRSDIFDISKEQSDLAAATMIMKYLKTENFFEYSEENEEYTLAPFEDTARRLIYPFEPQNKEVDP